MPKKITERGFAQYSDLIADDHGSTIYVQESSQAGVEGDEETGPWVWIYVDGDAILGRDAQIKRVGTSDTRTVEATSAAHLNVGQACAIRDALDEFIREADRG